MRKSQESSWTMGQILTWSSKQETPRCTLLFVAAMNGYDDVVRALLDKGVNVTAKVPGSASPVDAAKHNGHEAAAKMIAAAIKKKKAGAKAEKEGNELQRQLEEAWKDLDGDTLTKIAESCHFGRLPAVSRLSVLAATGDLAGVNSLLAGGMEPDLEVASSTVDIPPVIAASMRKGNVHVVRALLAAGANPNVLRADGSTALLIASSNGDTEAVKALTRSRCKPQPCLAEWPDRADECNRQWAGQGYRSLD